MNRNWDLTGLTIRLMKNDLSAEAEEIDHILKRSQPDDDQKSLSIWSDAL